MESWTAIVITCSSSSLAVCVEDEVKCLQKRGHVPSSIPILTVEDPADHMGSGAATVNGLLFVAEYLSAQKNLSVVNADVLDDAHILILHQGRDFAYSIGGKSLIMVPRHWLPNGNVSVDDHYSQGTCTNLELLLHLLGKLSKGSPPGIWVCSTDMSLIVNQVTPPNWQDISHGVLFCVPSNVAYALHHGCVTTDVEGNVGNITYCGSSNVIEHNVMEDGNVAIVSGVVFLSSRVGESLLSLYSVPPLESCTYMGLDSGAEPVQVSLFFDILMAMATGSDRNDFLSGAYGRIYNIKAGYSDQHAKTMVKARGLIWKKLSKFKLTSVLLENCQHLYWTNELPVRKFLQNFSSLISHKSYHSLLQVGGEAEVSEHLMINSIVRTVGSCTIHRDATIINSEISVRSMKIGSNSYLSGLSINDPENTSLNVPDDVVVLSFPSPDDVEDTVMVIFGVKDSLHIALTDPQFTFVNEYGTTFLKKLTSEDTWASEMKDSRNLFSAKIYSSQSVSVSFFHLIQETSDPNDIIRWKNSKKYSIEELLKSVNYSETMVHKRHIYSQVVTERIKEILIQMDDQPLLPYFRSACAEGWSDAVMKTLDSVLLSESHYDVLTRTLSSVADLLSIMAGKTGGLRTGPGSNKAWSTAFKSLLASETAIGMQQLAEERDKWVTKPSRIMRAARHYERAAQILIQNCLKPTKKLINLAITPMPNIGTWVEALCPARIDLQGGWTDTPPICYELGGSVVNAAVLIDGKKPIEAKACRKKEMNIEIVYGDRESQTSVVIEKVSDVLDYDQPYAQGALLKAALICAEVIDPQSEMCLQDQLVKCCGSGLEVHSYSNLPHGCGMGTSSILAGAIIAVLWTVTGRQFNHLSIIHAVLHIEQLLTTGGGWQDQVGGIMGGINRAISKPSLPLMVEVNPVCLSESALQLLNRHFLLIYTGKVRLAKNILQNVIRNWYARDHTIVNCFKDLLSCSISMESALIKGDLPEIGNLMNKYWEQKKILSPGCEPASIRSIMDILKPECHGQILVGAGGGGFMCILTTKPDSLEIIKKLLSEAKVAEEVTCHTVTIHSTGLAITRR